MESGQCTIGAGMKWRVFPPRSMTSSAPTSPTWRPPWYAATPATPLWLATTDAWGIASMTSLRPELWSGSTWFTTMWSTASSGTTVDTRCSSSSTNGVLTVSMSATLSPPFTRYALYVVPRGVS